VPTARRQARHSAPHPAPVRRRTPGRRRPLNRPSLSQPPSSPVRRSASLRRGLAL
jgi:hypothetical protein